MECLGRKNMDNVKIFNDTKKLVVTNEKLKVAIQESTKKQKIIREEDRISVSDLHRYQEKAKIVVSRKRTLEAASEYKEMKTAVHNFASASNPGGGVERGANAQEECLCRCSTLYFNLNTKKMWDEFYTPHRVTYNPLHNDDIIYTPNVIVFKTDTEKPVLKQENAWFPVDVITCAAPNLRPNPRNRNNTGDGNKGIKVTDKEILGMHEKRLKRILDVAVMQGNDAVILGAFGCGAFMNRANIVAMAAKNVIEKYVNAFRVIEFAVYCTPKDDENYRAFERMFKNSR